MKKLRLFISSIFFWTLPLIAQADGDGGGPSGFLGQIGVTAYGTEAADPRQIVAKLINVFISIMAALLIIYILYGGFRYMTAAGNDEHVKEAKTIIRNAIIGLVIILTAWSITRFVFQGLISATGG